MFDPRMGAYLRRAARLLGRSRPETTDAALLDRLVRDRDPAAFNELLNRHGPAVWVLCRRLTRTETDAEDVFQATFLVLIRDATKVRKSASVGSWLYGVASRIGRKARTKTHRTPDPTRLREPAPPQEPATDLSWNEVRAALDEELARLPDTLRAPILLCYFAGMTQDEAAVELGWNTRTVKARVARARELLRARLSRRGIELPAILSVPLLAAELASGAPARVHAGLTSAVANLVQGQSPGPDVSPAAVALAKTENPAMSFVRVALLLSSAMSLLAAGALVGQQISPKPDTAHAALPAADPPAPAAEPDPALPAGAVRLGTTAFRPEAGWHKKAFFTSNGKTLVAPQPGRVVELWDAETGKRTHEIPISKAGFHTSDYHAKSNLLALIGSVWSDNPVEETKSMVWFVDTATRKVTRTIPITDFDHSVHYELRFTPDGNRLIIGFDHEIRVWDVKSGEELLRQKHKELMNALAISPDGKSIIFGRYDLFLWKWESGEEPKKLVSLGGFGTELATFGGDGKTLLVATHGSRVATFDTDTGRQTGAFTLGSTAKKWSLSPDGKTIAIAFHDSSSATDVAHTVLLWDVAAGKELARLPVGRATATYPSWSPDGSRLVASTDSRFWVWDVKERKPLGPSASGHEGFIRTVAFGPDGQVFTASDDHTIRSWDPATGKPGLELIHNGWVHGVAVSPDGSLVAGASNHNDLCVWDAKTGTKRFQLLSGRSRKLRFTPDGKRLVTWGDDLYLRVWDTRNGKLLAENRTMPDGVTEAQLDEETSPLNLMIAFWPSDMSADGSTLAFCQHRVVQVFDTATGKERMKFEADANGVASLALSPDGKRVAVAGRGKRIEARLPNGRSRSTIAPEHQTTVWDLDAKKIIWQTTSTGSSFSGDIGFSPDGNRLAELISDDERRYAIRVWGMATGKDLGQIELAIRGGHFAFDRTGKRLAVTHWDTTVTIFDLETALKPSKPK